MPELVRVTDIATGHKFTIDRAKYDANSTAYRELKQPATDPAGFPLPPEYKTPDAPTSVKQAGTSANTTKE